MANVKTQVVTGKARLSFVNVFKPAPTPNGTMKYSVSVLIPKSDKETVDKFNKAFEETKTANADMFKGTAPKMIKGGLRDGDTEKTDAVYAGHYFFNASSNEKPGIFDANSEAIIDPNEVYSGCYGRVSVTMYPFDVSGSKGVAYGLRAVMKLEDGDKLGGSVSTAADFAV